MEQRTLNAWSKNYDKKDLEQYTKLLNIAKQQIKEAETINDLTTIWDRFPVFRKNQNFKDLMTKRKLEIKMS